MLVNMGKIQAIIFDWGGVLVEDPAPGLVKYCAKALGASEGKYEQAYVLCMDDFQTGKVTEKQFWMNMTSRLKVPMPKAKSLWGEAIKAVYVPRVEMFSLAARLRKADCKIALLSNTEMPCVEFFKKQKYDVFDVTVFSCLEGASKPNRAIYERTLNRLGTLAGRTLFIDDRQDYIDGAKRAGLRTVLFKSIEQLKKEMTKLSLNIV
jgi:putative hydrolase of the HAD superfamily